jgi:hypothetical protein
VDASSIDGLQPRYNDKSGWTTGAFNLNAAPWPNYGWGTYHQGVPDHDVGGDSLYIVKFPDGSMKKLMIRAKLGTSSGNIIRSADVDGANEFVDTLLTAPYVDLKNFIHYSLVNQQAVEAEPKKDEWDLLFTRYVIQIPTGPTSVMNYPVTGVLSNPAVTVAKVSGVPVEEAMDSQSGNGYVTDADAIGYDWKVTDAVTREVSIVDSLSYFIKSVDGNTYQLYFTEYGGQAAGTITFKVKKVE